MNPFFHVHAHSRYSVLDGTAPVSTMVDLAVAQEQPGLALTDHGNMSGSIELYRACKEAGIAAFPGIEAYIVRSLDTDEPRYHTGLLALDYEGYKALIRLSSMSFLPDGHFYRKPRISLDELCAFGDAFGDHVVLTTGCYFSLLVQTLLDKGRPAALRLLRELASHFTNIYVELQMHNTVHNLGVDHTLNGITDWDVSRMLHKMAVMAGVPVIIGQDSHYCDKRDKPAHEMMKRLGYHTSDENEILFPGNSYHLATTAWVERQYDGLRSAWTDSMQSFQDLIDLNRLSMPGIDNYHFNIPPMAKAPNKLLRRLVEAAYARNHKHGQLYVDAIDYELGIIKQMGFADYFLLVRKVVKHCWDNGIIINTRGSANGSLVCYLLGISQVDPIKWDVSFDRFLHPSRKKPPDIDIDVERDRRQEVIDYLSCEFHVTQIGTFMRMTDVEDRGAVFTKYLGYKRRVLGDQFHRSPFADIRALSDLNKIAPDDIPALRRLAGMEVCSSFGTHAAGLVLSSDTYPLSDYIPTMLVGGQNGNTITQMGMDDVEGAGFVKLDWLGLAALTTTSECMRMIGKDPALGMEWIPENDKQVCASMATGDTGTGIFQFEGYSTAVGARTMKIRSVKDAILCLALFRPAAMDSGNTERYLERRKGKAKPLTIHPVFDDVTKDTYGVFVLQDQVIELLRRLGMDFEDLNDMLKAVKASNNLIGWAMEVFDRIEQVFLDLCKDQGIGAVTAELMWKEIRGFSDYGFNKAHATAYGLLAYRMAWLRFHHPIEFYCALLQTWAGSKKEPQYTKEVRRRQIRIRRTNINVSGLNWSHDGESLYRGLLSVKGIGLTTAEKIIKLREEGGEFTSKEDVMKRGGKKIHNCMDDAGALGDLE